jgi:hypothetical protein
MRLVRKKTDFNRILDFLKIKKRQSKQYAGQLFVSFGLYLNTKLTSVYGPHFKSL